MNLKKRPVPTPKSDLQLSERCHCVGIHFLFLCALWESFAVTVGQNSVECSGNKRSGCATK